MIFFMNFLSSNHKILKKYRKPKDWKNSFLKKLNSFIEINISYIKKYKIIKNYFYLN
jgi:hypothetical protein